MSTYELDDEKVRLCLHNGGASLPQYLAEALSEQLPIPTPTKIGAVVRTDSKLCAPELSVFIRWASDVQTGEPWELREELDRRTYRTADIGRIVEVLSEGVDL